MDNPNRHFQDIVDAKTFRAVWQREMRTPVVVSIFVLVTVFFVVFLVKPRFGVAIWPNGLVLTLIWSSVYYGLFYGLFWRVMRAAVRRNIPLIVVFLGYFFGLSLFEFAVGPLYLPVGWGQSRAIWYLSTSLAVFPAATAICMLFYERQLRAGFAKIPGALPYWRPVPDRIDRLSHHLPDEKRGPIKRLQSRNQYVEVTTDNGSHILRMTLQTAIEAAAQDGLHVHRSLWLARSEIRALRYIDGNPKVLDAQGQVWPAGRQRVKEIRQLLEQEPRA